jgi:preprotein translocase subunit SecY
MGGFIPGIRPGESTAKFLEFTLNRILPFGALFLGLIALMPTVIQIITNITVFSFLVGGTSIMILVSVVLETMREIDSQLEMREYDSF